MHQVNTPVAIVGMACRFPGDVASPADLWTLLMDGRDTVQKGPDDRWDVEAFYDPSRDTPGRSLTRWAATLADITAFDAAHFGMPPGEARSLDPQHRLLLELSWEAFEHAGTPPTELAGTRTGVWFGLWSADNAMRLSGRYGLFDPYTATTGNTHSTAAGRVSYLLDLRGPAVAIDTACSSALAATHLAVRSLQAGETDLAVTGGAYVMQAPDFLLSASRYGMLSPTGRCRAFDAAGDGLVPGEGAATFVLKRLDDAQRDGDRVLAVIRGCAINQDGRSAGLTHPDEDAQRAVYREAVASAGIDPAEVGMVETHGPGTPVGDPIEFRSLSSVYGTGAHPMALTSVKTNIGHLLSAAGAAGLAKAVLALGHGLIPPNLHFRTWNPEIAAEAARGRFFVPTTATPWPVPGDSRYAAVSAFGWSGTNTHLILEAPEPARVSSATYPSPVPSSSNPVMVPLSATSPGVLGAAAGRLAAWLRDPDGRAITAQDVAHTMGVRRSRSSARLAVIATSTDELAERLTAYAQGQQPERVFVDTARPSAGRGAVWVFSGQGCQWAGMGNRLLAEESAFAATLAELEPLVAAEAGFSVTEALRGDLPTDIARLQVTLFASQVGLAQVWRARGLEPAAVIGHSMGEVSAAVVAGALTLADGVRASYRRARALKPLSGTGAMAAVSLPAEDVEKYLADQQLRTVTVAVYSSPRACVVSGDPPSIRRLVADLDSRGHLVREVASDVAAHGPQVDPHAGVLIDDLADLTPRTPAVPFYSTARPGHVPACDGRYWADNLRLPVRLTEAVGAAAAAGYTAFLEVSVHPVVVGAVREILDGVVAAPVVAHSIHRDRPGAMEISTQWARLHCAGVPVDFRRPYGNGRLVDVPTTTWDHSVQHWVDTPPAHPGQRSLTGEPTHPLLGVRTPVPDGGGRQLWQADLGTTPHPWLADHRVDGVRVLPGAAAAEIAIAAGIEHFACDPDEVEVSDLRLRQLLPLDDHSTVITCLTPGGEDRARVEIRTQDGAEWTTHATARITLVRQKSERPDDVPGDPSCTHDVDVAEMYRRLHALGYQHGAAFQALTNLLTDSDTKALFGRLLVPPIARTLAGPVQLHPVALDAALQTLLATSLRETATRNSVRMVPVGIGTLRVHRAVPADAELSCRTIVHTSTDESIVGTVRLADPDGTVLAEAVDVRFEPLATTTRARAEDALLHEIHWRSEPPSDRGQTPRSWVLLTDDPADPLPEAVSAALTEAGALAVRRAYDLPDTELADLAQTATDVLLIPGAHEVATDGARTTAFRSADIARPLASVDGRPPRLWIITRATQDVTGQETPVLTHGGLRGLARVIACEYPALRVTLVDLESPEPDDTAVGELLIELLADDSTADAGEEVAWRGGKRLVARLTPHPSRDRDWSDRPRRTARYGHDGIAVEPAVPGDLGTFGLVTRPRRAPEPAEVEIRVRAVGLNFADVLSHTGVLPAATTHGLGLECAGVVTEAGSDVTHLKPGDRVLTFSPGGVAATFATLPAALVAPIPDGFTDVSAATLPAAYLTAWYALEKVAHLAEGERVLIHSATGGVGLAALQIAAARGARVLATAGNDTKRDHLRRLGVETVMDSRSMDWVDQTMAATDGEGVDVVLNSLAGPAIAAGLSVLTIGGRFIELGKRDIIADTHVGLAPFRRGVTIAAVDLALLGRERPALVQRLLRELTERWSGGTEKPALAALPTTEYALADAATALRVMANAQHLGKLVLTVPSAGETTVAVPTGTEPVIRPGASYLVTGGLGGLGLEVAGWLTEGRAGRVVLNGRSAPTAAADRTIEALRAHGTEIVVVTGDIADAETAGRMTAAATADDRRLAGVIHAAAVLDDVALDHLDERRMTAVWEPKVGGAWHLHHATAEHELDWFVLFSSISALLGSPGQANYAAANSWLDTFARWRRSRGRPALAVAWGAWGQVGRATGLGRRGYATISTDDGLAALGSLLDRRRTHAGVFEWDPRHWFHAAPSASQAPLFAPLSDADQAAAPDHGADLAAHLRAETADRRRPRLVGYLAEQITTILGTPVAPDAASRLADVGFDSLSALQLRNRVRTDLGVAIPATAVWSHPRLADLADTVLDLLHLPGARPVAPRATSQPVRQRWWRTFTPRPDAEARLLCIPHAGGSASTYQPWQALLPDRVELSALQLPGREDRADEPPRTDLGALAAELAELVAANGDERPFALFGHSGGAVLAYALAAELELRGFRTPTLLAVSAMPPPHGPGWERLTAVLAEHRHRDVFGDIPAEVRQDPVLFAQARRALEADYTLYAHHPRTVRAPLTGPILATGGDADPLVAPEVLDEWHARTKAEATVRIYSGDHFYLRNHLADLVARITIRSGEG